MADVLEILDLYFTPDNQCHVEAVVDDMVLARRQTELDPPEWGAAVCRGSFYLCEDDVIPATDAGVRRLFSDRIDNWEVVDDSDLYEPGPDD